MNGYLLLPSGETSRLAIYGFEERLAAKFTYFQINFFDGKGKQISQRKLHQRESESRHKGPL